MAWQERRGAAIAWEAHPSLVALLLTLYAYRLMCGVKAVANGRTVGPAVLFTLTVSVCCMCYLVITSCPLDE